MSDQNTTNFTQTQGNFQYTYYTTYNPGNESTIITTEHHPVTQTYPISDDSKNKFIPLNIVSFQNGSTSSQTQNCIFVPQTILADQKPIIVNVSAQPSGSSLGESSTVAQNNIISPTIVTTTVSPQTVTVPPKPVKKEKKRSETVKVKIEQLKPRKGRKQKVPGQTREERKMKANTNKPYINSKGVEVQPRVFDENFDCQCPKKCTEKISLQARRGIFNMFWKMGSFEGRCCFINSCVNEFSKKRTTTKEPNKRKNSRKYYLKGYEVCKKTFCNTLKISGRTVDGSLLKAQMDDYSDMRGKAKKPNALTPEKINEVIDHVNSFPQNGKHLVDSTLTLKKMYELYKMGRDNPVSESSYKNIFYKKFRLRFEKIKKE